MPTITVYLPPEVYEKYLNDKNRKRGFIALLIADYYGFVVNKSRVVPKSVAPKA